MEVNLEKQSPDDLLKMISSQEKTINKKEKIIYKQEKELTKKDKLILKLEQEIDKLKEQLNLNRYEKFSPSSEKQIPEEQITFNEKPAKNSSKKQGRKPITPSLERKELIYDLQDDEKQCACGTALSEMETNDTSEQVDVIPMKIYVKKYIRKKYICRKCNKNIKIAKMPKLPIPKSIAAPGLLAHTMVVKYEDHVPLYRQENILQRIGISIPRATLSNWIISCAQLLKPLYELLQKEIAAYDVAYSDETTVQVLKEGDRKAQSTSYMWLFAGGGDNFCFIYKYNKSRGHEVPLELFKDFKGYLHCDGFKAYESLAKKVAIELSGCWYHFRRKLVEVIKVTKPGGLATQILDKITILSAIEKENKDLSEEAIKINRHNKSLPIINEIKEIIDNNINSTPDDSLINKALAYGQNQWPKLLTFLQDGRLEISNNLSERAIKPFVLGRKNWRVPLARNQTLRKEVMEAKAA